MADRRILPTNTGTESFMQSKHHWASSSEPAQALNPQQDSLDDLEMKKKKKKLLLQGNICLPWGKTGVTLGLHWGCTGVARFKRSCATGAATALPR